MKQQELIPHLFRTEFRKIVARLCGRYGLQHLEQAEDITSETFVAALETWPHRGIPENPAAWLYTVAKNKAANHFSRSRVFTEKVAVELKAAASAARNTEPDFPEGNIEDSQLRMLFAVCHPVLPREGQVALALRVLCGFGIDEIATAFLTGKETINKRLFRAREKLRREKVSLEVPGEAEITSRLDAVLTSLYLLYSEGYYSESNDLTLRKDFCLEAMRLVLLLLDNPSTDRPEVNALMALMCFHSSRFEARAEAPGEVVLYEEQDESHWNYELIARGAEFLHKASRGNHASRYHLEAAIAYWNTVKTDSREKWVTVLRLHNQLLQLYYSPLAALNRAYAFSKVHGNVAAIAEVEKLQLTASHFYYTLLGKLYAGTDDEKASANFVKALHLAKTTADKETILKKLSALPHKNIRPF